MNPIAVEFDFLEKLLSLPSWGQEGALLHQRMVIILGDLSSRRDSRDASDRLCRLIGEAYPPGELGARDVLSNPLTPLLVRLVVESLRKYSDALLKVESDSQTQRATTNERAKLLAKAAGFIGRDGTPHSKFTDDDGIAYLQAFGHHFHDPFYGRTFAAYDKGLAAAYARFRELENNPLGGEDPSDKSKTKRQLREFLKGHGYVRPVKRATLPPK